MGRVLARKRRIASLLDRPLTRRWEPAELPSQTDYVVEDVVLRERRERDVRFEPCVLDGVTPTRPVRPPSRLADSVIREKLRAPTAMPSLLSAVRLISRRMRVRSIAW